MPVTNPAPLVYFPMAPTPTKSAATPIIDETMHEMTTAGNEAKEEVSQGTQEIEERSGGSVEEGGSRVEHGMAEANHTSRVPEYDDNGDAHGLARTTRSVVEHQTTLEAPHDAPTPTTNDMICSTSVLHPPAKTTMPTKPPPSHIKLDLDGTMFTTPTTSGTASPAYDPTFIHHALVDSPRDPAATEHLDPTTLMFATPTSTTSTHSRLIPPCIPPMAPVHVDPVTIAATAAWSNATTATLMCFTFAMLSCRRVASFGSVHSRGCFRRF